jgi:hypothetical protein
VNYVINSVLNAVKAHPFIAAGLVIVLIVAFTFWRDRRAAAKYDKERAAYELNSKQWATERAGLLGRIAERDKQIEQLEAKEAAIIAIDQAGKKIDDALATKIDEVTKAAADEAIAVDAPADCWLRADRTCTKLAGLRPPININCDIYKRKLCSN